MLCRYGHEEEAGRQARPLPGVDRAGPAEITRRVVTEKISLLIGSFPNAAPPNAQTYTGMMIEEIIAANPSISALEATCRELRRSKTFVPTIAEVLKELREQTKMWGHVLDLWKDDIGHWVKQRARYVEASEAKEANGAPQLDDD